MDRLERLTKGCFKGKPMSASEFKKQSLAIKKKMNTERHRREQIRLILMGRKERAEGF